MKVSREAHVTRCSNGSIELVGVKGQGFGKLQAGQKVAVSIEVVEPPKPADAAASEKEVPDEKASKPEKSGK